MVLSNLFYDYVPLYNKFRVPSMILVVLQLTIPLLGFYTVWKIVKGDFERAVVLKGLKISLLIVGGICALFVLLPGLAGSFSAAADSNYPDWLQQCLPQDRKALLRSDALRSLVFVVLTAGCIWGIVRGKLKMERLLIVLCVLLALDMWTVDKRYLNNGHFVTQREFNNQFQARPVDKIILEDESLDYRVLDLSVNTFNDSHSSYFHKTIGGYSAAKLQRYQDLIDYFIAPKIDAVIQEAKQGATYSSLTQSLSTDPILNMLNTKYIIVDANSNPIENRSAYGNAWFVKDYELVNTADEEIIKLAQIEPSEMAVIAKEFAPIVQDRGINFDDSATIQLISYAPNKLEYRTRAKDEQLAVFSEIYYPKGWHVYVDGQEVEHFRTDYVLRAMFVPAGEHVITFEFRPDSYFVGSKISAASSGLLLFALFGFIMIYIIRYYRKDTIAGA